MEKLRVNDRKKSATAWSVVAFAAALWLETRVLLCSIVQGRLVMAHWQSG